MSVYLCHRKDNDNLVITVKLPESGFPDAPLYDALLFDAISLFYIAEICNS